MSDDNGKFTEDELKSLKISDISKDILRNLTAREAKVLRDRFGTKLHDNIDLQEIGKRFDITKERIEEIEEKALKKLRSRSESNKIRCSFCGEEKSKVNKLVASEITNSYICEKCIKISTEILDE